jgi:hypothetical protein
MNVIKKFIFALALILLESFSTRAAQTPLENFCPHFSTNMPIIWNAPMTNLPKILWTYKKILPRVFSKTIISNAVILASFQSRGFPPPSTNDTCIIVDDCHCSCLSVCNFAISPRWATISYLRPQLAPVSTNIPDDKMLAKWALHCASQLGIDPSQVSLKDVIFHFNSDENGNQFTNQIAGRGVYLSRQFDGITFIGNGNDGYMVQGFYIEFGTYGEVRNFNLVWPDVERQTNSQIADSSQIIRCIEAHKVIVFPDDNETNYLERVKNIGAAKKFTIKKIKLYYGEGEIGNMPENDEPIIFAPFAELECVADFGDSNSTVRLFSPILSTDVKRLLAQK